MTTTLGRTLALATKRGIPNHQTTEAAEEIIAERCRQRMGMAPATIPPAHLAVLRQIVTRLGIEEPPIL